MKKLLAIMLCVGMSAGLLAGCGGKAASVAEKDTLIVGTNAEFPPFEYVTDSGEPDGFDMALIKAVGDKMGKKVEIQNMEFDSLVSSIGSKIDMAIAGMTVTEERQKTVNFSDPYYTAVQYVIVPTDSAIAGADDLQGIRIGVQLGTTGDFIASEISGSTISRYNKAVDAVNDLLNGRLDCVIIDKNPAETFVGMHSDELKTIEGEAFEFEEESYAIAMPKNDNELTDAVNAALSELKADGTYDSLVKQYIEEN